MLRDSISATIEDVRRLVTKEAKKLVFIAIALSVIAFTATGILDGESFKGFAMMVFSFYFATKKNIKG